MLAILDTPALVVSDLVLAIGRALEPVLGDAATAGAIITLTLLVRLLLLPVGLRAARAARARQALRPQELELRRRFRDQPARLHHELHELHERHQVRPFSSVVPLLAQVPVFMVLYRLFASPTLNGHANALFTHAVFGVPLSDSWLTDLAAGLVPPELIVFGTVFVLLIAVACWSSWQARRSMTSTMSQLEGLPPELATAQRSISRVTALLPFGTPVVAMFVPLAAALYLLTTTAWAAAERWALGTYRTAAKAA
ncbi:membrane protein insertase YidC [Jiangella gansuensis]|uniref:membrane protein insertase YidC n=1 Tax=Jiangella gansuensis TaxID=281473 RepID=UPI00047CB321|nr:membrane protein insertase YidC [Jiangella gansuensis]